MASFKDGKGRVWTLDITVLTLRRVKSDTGVDLLEVLGPNAALLRRIYDEPLLLASVLWSIARVTNRAQADEVTEDGFMEQLAGDVLDQATHALLEAIVSFFPSPKDRKNLAAVLKATDEAMDKAREMAAKELEGLDVAAMAESARAAHGASSINAPASPASTPQTSPSGSSS